jgi:hypothetical protein
MSALITGKAKKPAEQEKTLASQSEGAVANLHQFHFSPHHHPDINSQNHNSIISFHHMTCTQSFIIPWQSIQTFLPRLHLK